MTAGLSRATALRLVGGVSAFALILFFGLAQPPTLYDGTRTQAGISGLSTDERAANPAVEDDGGRDGTGPDASGDDANGQAATSLQTTIDTVESAGSTVVNSTPDGGPPTTAESGAPPPTTAGPPPSTGDSTATPVDPQVPVVVARPGDFAGPKLEVHIAIESRVDDVDRGDLAQFIMQTLNGADGWPQAGFSFVEDPASELRVVLAEGSEVDRLCAPLRTRSQVSCQNGAVVAMNATRWREATDSWDNTVELYRKYLVNHEVGHLIGQRHPTPRCPVPGAPAAVMEQQTKGLEGCVGSGIPRQWEIDYAALRPAVIGPFPSWAPDPVPANLEGR